MNKSPWGEMGCNLLHIHGTGLTAHVDPQSPEEMRGEWCS